MLNEISLKEYISRIYRDRSHGTHMADFFNRMCMPLPEKWEFFETSETGLFVPLKETALILRVRHIREDDAPYIQHFRVIKPVAHRHYGDTHIDILPGVRVPASKESTQELAQTLYEDGIDFHDCYQKNTGVLPDGMSIVIDSGAIKWISETGKIESAMLQLPHSQDTHFSSLTKTFNEAWPQDKKEPDLERMKKFWQTAKEMKEKGTLVASWHDPELKKYIGFTAQEIVNISNNYARAWPCP
ncbi:MAG: hypothetical protein H6853_03005 [Rhodospirillales bacterium]|nr:MAG: hypothetical protein H6853_03005 [Rhodospirillales bacterium]